MRYPNKLKPINCEYMKSRRLQLGFSQNKVAMMAGMCSATYYAALERGRHPNVRAVTISRIAWALGVKVDRLMPPLPNDDLPPRRDKPWIKETTESDPRLQPEITDARGPRMVEAERTGSALARVPAGDHRNDQHREDQGDQGG